LHHADYLATATTFARLLLPVLRGLSADDLTDKAGHDLLDLGLTDGVAVRRQPGLAHGFTPGDPHAPPAGSFEELSAWYWARATPLLGDPKVVVTRLETRERSVPQLERARIREASSLALALPRSLRRSALTPEDDASQADFSDVRAAEQRPHVNGVTFGIGRVFASFPFPFHTTHTVLRQGFRLEKLVVKSKSTVSELGGDADSCRRILLVRDSSGSMGGFHLGSNLDRVTLGVYCLLKTLQVQGRQRDYQLGAVDFSDTTRFSGYQSWSKLEAFERVLLSAQCGGTTLDVSVLKEALRGDERTLVLFLSDGGLEVRNGDVDETIRLLQQHASYVIAAEHGISSFCAATAQANLPTLLLDRLEHVGTVFGALVSSASEK
jgi:hypothetical protein